MSVIVIGTGVETAIVNAFGVEPELLSEKVIVKLNGLPAAVVGVPLITPAAGSRASPGGSAPLLMIQFYKAGIPRWQTGPHNRRRP